MSKIVLEYILAQKVFTFNCLRGVERKVSSRETYKRGTEEVHYSNTL